MASIEQWVEAAAGDLVQLLATEHALIYPSEVNARLAERYFESEGPRSNFEPHVLGIAVDELLDGGYLKREVGGRGNRQITTLELVGSAPGSKSHIASAKAHKRELYSTYLTWAQGSGKGRPGTLGDAGETATRAAFGPRITEWDSRARILGIDLAGPVDIAGFMVPYDETGMPQAPVTVIVEVKNVRQFIYPEHEEVAQLLHKAFTITSARPQYPLLPVLVCRRAHKTTHWMAKQLGFMVVQTFAQFVGDVDQHAIDRVRVDAGLGFSDLKQGVEPNKYMIKQLNLTAPREAARLAAVWASHVSNAKIAPLLAAATARDVALPIRKKAMYALQSALLLAGGGPGWMLGR